MSRVNPGILALFATAIIGAALVVLYVIGANPVHEPVPQALAALTPEPAPKPIADMAVVDKDGGKVRLAKFRGRLVILNVWAPWCAPCVRELPALGRLEAALGAGRVMVVTVNASRDTAAQTASFL